MTEFKTMNSPFRFGSLTLKNRIIFAPTTMGLPEEEYLEKLEAIAAGGCAMIIIGDVPVGKSVPGTSLFSGKGFLRYQRICRAIHQHGCLVSAQLHRNDTRFQGIVKYIPGLLTGRISQMDLRHLLNEETGRYISSIPAETVKQITASFGEAAVKAAEAGFDLVQVHGDRMCGSFSSSLFNTRTDEYGGSPENRARFACEAVRAIRSRLPEIPIDYKLAVRTESPHYGNAGITEDEISVFVPLLEEAGVTGFHTALANHGKLEDTIPPADHPYFSEEGCFLRFCDAVRACTSLPICGVGGLNDPAFIEAQLSSGRMDCAAMSRQLIADPDFVKKTAAGHPEQIRRCIRCNRKCLGGMYEHKGVHCIYDSSR